LFIVPPLTTTVEELEDVDGTEVVVPELTITVLLLVVGELVVVVPGFTTIVLEEVEAVGV
jgi:hypothetical protein